ncbi:helix-turn-helix domain-containing protein [Mycobacteroides abscessus]|uniref:helix-turn-helix domain-containing protein n=1 Tax=Mycobacteroides abscessus TaxID=36809 RepID=UPI000C25757B|nr:helix-turn-helix domain-containing protein [Mycobacteroides abscessus]
MTAAAAHYLPSPSPATHTTRTLTRKPTSRTRRRPVPVRFLRVLDTLIAEATADAPPVNTDTKACKRADTQPQEKQTSGQVAGILAHTFDLGRLPATVFEIRHPDLATWLTNEINSPLLKVLQPEPDRPRRILQVYDNLNTLAPFGYAGGRKWKFQTDSHWRAQMLRGAVVAAGFPMPHGLRILTPNAIRTNKLLDSISATGVEATREYRFNAVSVLVCAEDVPTFLTAIGLPESASAYAAAASVAAAQLEELSRANMRVANDRRSKAAGQRDVEAIKALGDLNQYQLRPSYIAAATARRDNPDKTFAELGELLGVGKDSFSGTMRRFWQAIDQRTGNDRKDKQS